MEEETQKYTVDDALIAMGSGKFQIYLLAYAGMGWIAEAMEMMLLSFVGPAVQAEWGLSPNKESMITSVVFAGMLIGSYSWGIVSDKYGRRNGFFITAIFTSAAGISSALAPNYATLIFFRFFVGLGLGGGPVLSSWLLEFIPAPRRVPSAVLLVFYRTAPESPRYLCRTGRTDEAVEILERIARLNQAELPPGILVSEHQFAKIVDLPSEDARLLSPNKGEIEIVDSLDSTSCPQKGTSVFTLLSPQLLRSTLLLWVVFIGNAFAYYGLVLLTTALSSGDNKCTPNHSPSESGKSLDVNYRNVFITSFAEFPGLLLSAAMVDKVGRKIYPTSVRTTGVGVASSMGRIGGMTCPLVAVSLIHGCHRTTAILLFEAIIFVSGVSVLLFPIETSGRDLSDEVSDMNQEVELT
uniref:Major facilitator superfamily (MFS) profile domain-containing protein n=1 Tax=Chenopodium quinoa TaxID=63459 RepID=A0A803KQK2_CHEQI